MFYIILSIIFVLFSPDSGHLMAENIRDFMGIGINGWWFWLIGLLIYGAVTN